jgi:8-oxo-dGTP pyrophosphatase MutT (NUDIX family)
MSSSQMDSPTLRRLIENRLRGTQPARSMMEARPAGVTGELDAALRVYLPTSPTPSAVLVPIIDRPEGLTVLMTERSSTLRNHAGQISFPGGRVEPDDDGPIATALRETEEEIGLSREYVSFAGYLHSYLVLTGYWITPVVGFVRPGFALHLDPGEVASAFEVPLSHILDLTNHQARERMIGPTAVQVYDIPFEEHNIWGATAGILIDLYRLVTEAIAAAGAP